MCCVQLFFKEETDKNVIGKQNIDAIVDSHSVPTAEKTVSWNCTAEILSLRSFFNEKFCHLYHSIVYMHYWRLRITSVGDTVSDVRLFCNREHCIVISVVSMTSNLKIHNGGSAPGKAFFKGSAGGPLRRSHIRQKRKPIEYPKIVHCVLEWVCRT